MTEISGWTEPSFYQKPSETGELVRIDLGPVKPPLSESEISSFERHGLSPNTLLTWANLPPLSVLAALAISGSHFREDNPDFTSETLLAYKAETE